MTPVEPPAMSCVYQQAVHGVNGWTIHSALIKKFDFSFKLLGQVCRGWREAEHGWGAGGWVLVCRVCRGMRKTWYCVCKCTYLPWVFSVGKEKRAVVGDLLGWTMGDAAALHAVRKEGRDSKS